MACFEGGAAVLEGEAGRTDEEVDILTVEIERSSDLRMVTLVEFAREGRKCVWIKVTSREKKRVNPS